MLPPEARTQLIGPKMAPKQSFCIGSVVAQPSTDWERGFVGPLPCPLPLEGRGSFLQVDVALRKQLLVGVAHQLGAGLAEHHLEIDRLEAFVNVAMDDP